MSSSDIKGVAEGTPGRLVTHRMDDGRWRASYRCKGTMAAIMAGFGDTEQDALLALAQGLLAGMIDPLDSESAAPSAATVLHLAKAWEAML